MKCIFTIFCLLLASVAQAADVNATLDWANRRVAAFAVYGVVEKINVAVGEQVKKGQLLAQLDQVPFIYQVRKAQANADGIKSRLFDAKQNFDQAQELFDRTVLSQVELQRAEMQYQGVESEQAAAKAELEIARWQQRQSVINAACDCVIISNALLPGMIINADNQHVMQIEMAEAGVMNADMTLDPGVNIKMQQSVQLSVAGKNYSAVVVGLAAKNGKLLVRVQFRVDVATPLFAGQGAKVKF